MKSLILLFFLISFSVLGLSAQSTMLLSKPRYSELPQKSIRNLEETVVIPPKNDSNVRLVCGCGIKHSPLYLIKFNNKKYILDTTAVISPQWVSDLYVITDTTRYNYIQYSSKAKNGIIIMTLDEKRYPLIIDSLKSRVKKID